MSSRSIKSAGLHVIHDRAAGVDIGARFHVVAVPPELCDQPVQTFQAFTGDIERMADWLVSIGIKTVAMEPQLRPSSPCRDRRMTCACRPALGQLKRFGPLGSLPGHSGNGCLQLRAGPAKEPRSENNRFW